MKKEPRTPRSRWGVRTPKPDHDPRAELRALEGTLVGIYDLTTLSTTILEEALATNGTTVKVTVKGLNAPTLVPRTTVEAVLHAKTRCAVS